MNTAIAGLELGFVDFLKLCGPESAASREDEQGQTYFEWFDHMRVYRSGVYLTDPKGLLLDELAAMPNPPDGDYTKPVLSFPCTLAALEGFLNRYEFIGIPDAFILADWIASKRQTAPVTTLSEWPYQHDTKLLDAARWVIETWAGDTHWPASKLVIDKLKEFKDLGANEAKYVDAVTRPDHIRNR